LNRKSISLEIENEWTDVIVNRLKNHTPDLTKIVKQKHDVMKLNGRKVNETQQSLFT